MAWLNSTDSIASASTTSPASGLISSMASVRGASSVSASTRKVQLWSPTSASPVVATRPASTSTVYCSPGCIRAAGWKNRSAAIISIMPGSSAPSGPIKRRLESCTLAGSSSKLNSTMISSSASTLSQPNAG